MALHRRASRAGFYAWLVRSPSRRTVEDEAILMAIRKSFADSDRTYGVPRIWPDLKDWQIDCGR